MANFIKKTAMSVDNGARFLANIPLRIIGFIFDVIAVVLFVTSRLYVTIPFFLFFMLQDQYMQMGYSEFSLKLIPEFLRFGFRSDSFKVNAAFAIFIGVVVAFVIRFIRHFILENISTIFSGMLLKNEARIEKNNKAIDEIERLAGRTEADYNKDVADDYKRSSNYVER